MTLDGLELPQLRLHAKIGFFSYPNHFHVALPDSRCVCGGFHSSTDSTGTGVVAATRCLNRIPRIPVPTQFLSLVPPRLAQGASQAFDKSGVAGETRTDVVGIFDLGRDEQNEMSGTYGYDVGCVSGHGTWRDAAKGTPDRTITTPYIGVCPATRPGNSIFTRLYPSKSRNCALITFHHVYPTAQI
jgi:hypothetical protein